jgi:hypothetical protein
MSVLQPPPKTNDFREIYRWMNDIYRSLAGTELTLSDVDAIISMVLSTSSMTEPLLESRINDAIKKISIMDKSNDSAVELDNNKRFIMELI